MRRALPDARRRSVGPFVFFDHMGPVDLPPGEGMDVRPHPHIGLAHWAMRALEVTGGAMDRSAQAALALIEAATLGRVQWTLPATRGSLGSRASAPSTRIDAVAVHGGAP